MNSEITVTGTTLISLVPALPEIYLVGAICVLLMADVFFGEKNRGLAPTLTLLILAGGAAVTLFYANVTQRTLLFSESYVADGLAVLLKLFGFMSMAVALFYSRAYLQRRGMMRGEYYVLALTALLGIFVIVSANSLLTLYIGVELLSLSLYAMVAFERENGVAAESAMKYFVLGAIASGMLLYGMSLIYGMTGTLMLDDLSAMATGEPSLGVILGLVFLVVAVAFKFGAVPFHMWVPDVYTGAPTGVTLFLSTLPKIASFALAFRLLAHGLGSVGATWQDMLAPLAVLSMVFGNVVAIAQSNLKRMLAYSAIGNVGFILLGFVAGSEAGYEAALYYTIAYVIMTLGSFGVLVLASRQGFEAEDLDHFKGLHKRDPLLALSDARAHVFHRWRAAVHRLLGEVQHLPGAVAHRALLAHSHRRGHVRGRRVLLPAHRETYVFRRARRTALRPVERHGRTRRARPQWIGGAGSGNRAQRIDSTVRTRHRLTQVRHWVNKVCKAATLG